VSPAAHEDTEEAEGYVERFEQEPGWRPAKIALISGALQYTHYGFVKRRLVKKIGS
jgi:menaquinone-dependent protoporphyrinogen oxidase